MNIFVGNLPFRATESDVRELFEAHGAVDAVRVVTDRDTGRSRGFGFVEMPDQDHANAAIEALNGHEMMGRDLRVNESQPRGPRDRRPDRDRW